MPSKDKVVHFPAEATVGHNRQYDGEKLAAYLNEFAAEQDNIDLINAEAREQCEPYRNQQKQIKDAAKKELGVPKAVFTHLIKEMKLADEIGELGKRLTPEQREIRDQTRQAMGWLEGLAGTPFGDFAERKAKEE